MLTSKQRTALEAKAKERGIDAAKLIAEAESLLTAKPDATASAPAKSAEKPNLFMYLLPFVTVNEVRTIWLELSEVAGGETYAAEWAAKQTSASAPTPEPTK